MRLAATAAGGRVSGDRFGGGADHVGGGDRFGRGVDVAVTSRQWWRRASGMKWLCAVAN
jgi:hypothetical protein